MASPIAGTRHNQSPLVLHVLWVPTVTQGWLHSPQGSLYFASSSSPPHQESMDPFTFPALGSFLEYRISEFIQNTGFWLAVKCALLLPPWLPSLCHSVFADRVLVTTLVSFPVACREGLWKGSYTAPSIWAAASVSCSAIQESFCSPSQSVCLLPHLCLLLLFYCRSQDLLY